MSCKKGFDLTNLFVYPNPDNCMEVPSVLTTEPFRPRVERAFFVELIVPTPQQMSDFVPTVSNGAVGLRRAAGSEPGRLLRVRHDVTGPHCPLAHSTREDAIRCFKARRVVPSHHLAGDVWGLDAKERVVRWAQICLQKHSTPIEAILRDQPCTLDSLYLVEEPVVSLFPAAGGILSSGKRISCPACKQTVSPPKPRDKEWVCSSCLKDYVLPRERDFFFEMLYRHVPILGSNKTNTLGHLGSLVQARINASLVHQVSWTIPHNVRAQRETGVGPAAKWLTAAILLPAPLTIDDMSNVLEDSLVLFAPQMQRRPSHLDNAKCEAKIPQPGVCGPQLGILCDSMYVDYIQPSFNDHLGGLLALPHPVRVVDGVYRLLEISLQRALNRGLRPNCLNATPTFTHVGEDRATYVCDALTFIATSFAFEDRLLGMWAQSTVSFAKEAAEIMTTVWQVSRSRLNDIRQVYIREALRCYT